MAILVTGAAGFIGSHLIELLIEQSGQSVVGLDNFNDYYDPKLKRSNAERLGELDNFALIEGDFCDEQTCEHIFSQHDIQQVVHLGAYAGVRISVQQPLVYQKNNVGGTLTLLEAVRKRPVNRFLLVSSSTVYGPTAGIPFQEDAPLSVPASPYGATKRSAELLGLTYHQLHDVPVVCLRPFSVYGPRLRPDLALTIFTDAIENGKKLPLFGDGSIRRDFTHVTDICQGLISALTAESAVGETINLGHSEPVEMRKIISMIEDALGKKANIDHLPERPEDLPVTFADLSKAKRILNYEPKVPIDKGIREYCAWFREWYNQGSSA